MIGHIKLDRRILDWEWYDDNVIFKVFLHILLTANYKDSKWQGIDIKRGQLIISINNLSVKTGVSKQQARRAISSLQKTGEITFKSTNKYSTITICKYDTYQSVKIDSNTQNNTQTTCETTSKQQTNRKQTTTDKESKEVISKERVIGEEEKLPAPIIDLSKSNLYRQPVIPSKDQVWECFYRQGGTKEMAKVFFDNNSGTGWFLKGSPITNFTNLVPSFIANWKKFEKKDLPEDSKNVKITVK